MGRKWLLCGSIWIFLILIMMTFLAALPVSASPLTSVTLDLQDEIPSVDVSPGSSGIVTAQGTIFCEKWGPDQVKVSLTGNSTCDGANVNPPSMVFGGPSGSEETRTFSATTRVPQETSCSETPILTVSGIFVQGGIQNDIDPVSIDIEILQFYSIDILFDEGGSRTKNNTVIKAGENLDLEFDVYNMGNGNDVFQVDFQKREELESQGFSLPNSEIVSIPEKRNEGIDWSIGTSQDMSGVYKLEISVISEGSDESGGNVKYISTINIKVEERTATDRILGIFLSPLGVILLIVISLIIIVVWYKRRG